MEECDILCRIKKIGTFKYYSLWRVLLSLVSKNCIVQHNKRGQFSDFSLNKLSVDDTIIHFRKKTEYSLFFHKED